MVKISNRLLAILLKSPPTLPAIRYFFRLFPEPPVRLDRPAPCIRNLEQKFPEYSDPLGPVIASSCSRQLASACLAGCQPDRNKVFAEFGKASVATGKTRDTHKGENLPASGKTDCERIRLKNASYRVDTEYCFPSVCKVRFRRRWRFGADTERKRERKQFELYLHSRIRQDRAETRDPGRYAPGGGASRFSPPQNVPSRQWFDGIGLPAEFLQTRLP